MKRLSIFFLFLTFLALAKADDFKHGLKFNSNDFLISERTSLVLFPEADRVFSDKFTLSFSFKMEEVRFGYILRIVDGTNEYSLNCVPFRDNTNCYLDFFNNHNKIGQLVLSKSILQSGQHSTFEISFNLAEKTVIMSVFDQTEKFQIEELPRKIAPSFIFGLYGKNLDVAPISIKDVKIFNAREKLVNFWPLNEKSGTESLDIIGNEKAGIKNPNWIAKSHFFWKNPKNYLVEADADIAFDKTKNQVLIAGKDSLIKYSLTDGSSTVIHYKNSNPVINEGFNIIYNDKLGRLESYILHIPGEMNKIPMYSTYNEQLNTWTSPDSATSLLKMWQHEAFFTNNNLSLFGGYGNFKYHNQFLLYNQKSNDWDTLSIKGDPICPRFFPAVGNANNDSILYLFGGFGNSSGQQEYGGLNLYDLYKINTKSQIAKKLFELTPHTIPFVPFQNLLVDNEEKFIYSLMFPHHQPNSFVALIKIDLAKHSYEVISDSIPLKSEKIRTHAKLYQTQDKRHLVTVAKEYDARIGMARIGIYTLDTPPSEDRFLQSIWNNTSKNQLPLWIILISAVLVVLIMVMAVLLLKKKFKSDTPEELDTLKENDNNPLIQPNQQTNSIYLFGDFLVIDKRGKNICHLFPPKIQQALILLIIKSVSESEGISSIDFSRTLWPDKDNDQLKNIRGVTLNHLRNSLEDVDGVQVVYSEQKKWQLECNSNFNCDYFEFIKLKNSDELTKTEKLNTLLPILKRGTFIPNVNDPISDLHKSTVENYIIDLSVEIGEGLFADQKYEQVNELMQVLSSFSLLNESILSLKIRALMKLGKIKQAKNQFHHFCVEHKKMLDIDYHKSFKDLY